MSHAAIQRRQRARHGADGGGLRGVLLFFSGITSVEYEYVHQQFAGFAKVFRPRPSARSWATPDASECTTRPAPAGQLPPLSGRDEGRGRELVRQPRRKPLPISITSESKSFCQLSSGRAKEMVGRLIAGACLAGVYQGGKAVSARVSGRSFLSEGRKHDLSG